MALLDTFAEKSRRAYCVKEVRAILESYHLQKIDKKHEEKSMQQEKPEYTFFSGAFKGVGFVEHFFELFNIKNDLSNEYVDQCVDSILNHTLLVKNEKNQNRAKLFLTKMNKALEGDHHWFSKNSLNESTSFSQTLQIFYRDAVTMGNHNSASAKYPEARCICGLVVDSERILSDLYRVKNLDHFQDIGCKG